MKGIFLLGAFLLIGMLTPAFSEIYKYSDGKQTWYVDRIAVIPEAHRKTFPQSNTSLDSSNPYPQNQPGPLQLMRSHQRVEVFVTPNCPYCRQLEAFLESKGIRYMRYDIETSPYGKKLYDQLNEEGVPVTRIGSQIISGFNPNQILSALGMS